MKTTEYKDSEVGRIPADWKVAQLKDLTDIITGATPSTSINEYWNGDIPWMSSGELNMKLVRSVYGRITQKGYDSCGTHMIPPLCVLIGLAGQGKTRGTAAINYISLCTNQSIASILPSSYFDSFFLFYWLDNQYYNLRMLSAGDGGRGGLNKQLLLNLWVPLPPLKEQNAIANSLSSIDSLISSLDELIEKKRMIKDGLMQELLTGKKRLKGFSGKWERVKLNEIAEMSSGGTPSSKEVSFYGGDIPFLSISDMTSSGKYIFRTEKTITKLGLENSSARVFPPGTLMYAMYASLGKCSITNIEVAISQAILGFKLSPRVDKMFLYYHFCYIEESVKKIGQTGTQSNLSKQIVENFALELPEIDEQKAIGRVLSDIDLEISTIESMRDKYLLIKQGMMQQLLTGKTRL